VKKTLAAALLAIAAAFVVASSANPPALGQQSCTLTFITESLPEGFVGVPYSFQLEACCGTPPYKFKIVDGALPAGLSMTQDGLITGTPTQAEFTTVFIRLRDHGGGNCSLVQAFAMTVSTPE
jgi:putative Ig domain-containing protein